jgi:large subunit ribosomal protein L10
MVQAKKVEVVTAVVDSIRRSKSSIFVDYRGLTVAEATRLRARCREANVLYHVIKNRLTRRAYEQVGMHPPQAMLEGPTAIAFGVADPTAPARVFMDFLKTTEHVHIKGGFVGAQWLDAKGVAALSRIPPREVLLARLTGSLKGPIVRFVWGMRSPAAKLAMALKAVAEKQQPA